MTVMADYLLSVVLAHPWLWWVPVFALGYALGMALAMNQNARDLVADVRRAMARADLTGDRVSRCAEVPPNKFSDQLRGVSPFTAMWRLFAADEIAATDLEVEYLDLRARRRGLMLVRADLGALLQRLDEALTGKRPMAKAELVAVTDREVSA